MGDDHRRGFMGDRVCYMSYCPACERAVPATDDRCPDCGGPTERR